MVKKSKGKASVTTSAKAEAVVKATATYRRERKTTEVIPPDVTRSRNAAWLDLISPLTEWAGLKGDELNYKRMQLRLQREDVLTEIVNKARTKLIGANQTPLPNKFLVPFLEKASLENPGNPLTDMWASLLASAAEDFASYHIHFVSIISQLSPAQGRLLSTIIRTTDKKACEKAVDEIKAWYERHSIQMFVKFETKSIEWEDNPNIKLSRCLQLSWR